MSRKTQGFDPSILEPKNGDFSAYVEELNKKTAKDLSPMNIGHAQSTDTMGEVLQNAQRIEPASPVTEPKHFGTLPAADPVMNVPRPGRASGKKVADKFVPVWIFFAFCTIFIGIFMEDETIIGAGFVMSFFTILIGILLQFFIGRRR